MKHLNDIVTFDEAVRLKKENCTIEANHIYKVNSIVENKHVLEHMMIKRDWGNWNGGSDRIFTAPTYAEVFDWMADKGYDWPTILDFALTVLRDQKQIEI